MAINLDPIAVTMLNISDLTFDSNSAFSAAGFGGALYLDLDAQTSTAVPPINESRLVLSNMLFINNQNYGLAGGALFVKIYLRASSLILQGATFTNNSILCNTAPALPSGCYAGAAMVMGSTTTLIRSSTFSNNSLFGAASSSPETIQAGGALFLDGYTTDTPHQLAIQDSEFFFNRVVAVGGITEAGALGITLYPSDSLILSNTTFFANSILHSQPGVNSQSSLGGALAIQCSFAKLLPKTPFIQISNSQFLQNSATGSSGKLCSLYESAGGAIYAEGYVTFQVVDSIFQNNSITSADTHCDIGNKATGGAISLVEARSVLLSLVSFTDNAALTGNASILAGPARGGAFHLSTEVPSLVVVVDSYFQNNTATSGNTVSPSEAQQGVSTAGGIAEGGAIYCASQQTNLVIQNCSFDKNGVRLGSSDPGHSSSGTGGAVSISIPSQLPSLLSLETCTFSNNQIFGGYGSAGTMPSYGGAVSMSLCTTTTAILQTTFNNNQISASSSISGAAGDSYGGAISLRSSSTACASVVSLQGCGFEANHIAGAWGQTRGSSFGGGLSVELSSSNISVSNTIFLNNTCTSSLLPSVEAQTSTTQGGAISLIQGTMLSVSHCTFHGNTVVSYPDGDALGGAVAVIPATSINLLPIHALLAITFFNCSFDANFASLSLLSNVTSDPLSPSSRSSKSAGGALFMAFEQQVIGLNDCSFTMNSASQSSSIFGSSTTSMGGAIATSGVVNGTRMQITGCVFDSNHVYGGSAYGGSLFHEYSSLSIEGSNISNSYARALSSPSAQFRSAGGSMFLKDSSLEAFSSVFITNSLADYGGALVSPLIQSFENSWFDNTAASYGGGVIFFSDVSTTQALSNLSSAIQVSSRNSSSTYGVTSTIPISIDPPVGSLFIWPSLHFSLYFQLLDAFSNPVYNPTDYVLLAPTDELVQNDGATVSAVDPLSFQYLLGPLYSTALPGSQMNITIYVESTPTSDLVSSLDSELVLNVLPCPPGYLMTISAAHAYCLPCPSNSYSFSGAHDCLPCLAASPCMTTISESPPYSFTIVKGYWIWPNASTPQELLICPNPLACQTQNCEIQPVDGSDDLQWDWLISCLNSSSDRCAQGYTNRLCSECSPGWFAVANSYCLECSSESTWVLPLILVAIVLLIGILAMGNYLVGFFAQVVLAIGGYLINLTPFWLVSLMFFLLLIAVVNRLARRFSESLGDYARVSPLSSGTVKSLVFFCQFESALVGSNLFNINMATFVDKLSFLRLTSLECMSEDLFGAYQQRFILYLLIPLIGGLVGLLVLTTRWLGFQVQTMWYRHTPKEKDDPPISSASESDDFLSDPLIEEAPNSTIDSSFPWKDNFRKVCRGYFFFLFIIYSQMTDKMMQVINCDPYGYIQNYPYIPCAPPLGSPGSAIFVLAIIFLILFTIGLPVLFGFLLWRYRLSLADHATVKLLGFLYEAFRFPTYLWGIVSFFRNFIFLCLINFIPSPSLTYLVVITLFLIVVLLLQIWLHPFRTTLENWVEVISISALLLIHITNQYVESQALPSTGHLRWYALGFNAFIFLWFLCVLLLPTWRTAWTQIQWLLQGFEEPGEVEFELLDELGETDRFFTAREVEAILRRRTSQRYSGQSSRKHSSSRRSIDQRSSSHLHHLSTVDLTFQDEE